MFNKNTEKPGHYVRLTETWSTLVDFVATMLKTTDTELIGICPYSLTFGTNFSTKG
jgi:hypothetical protein